MVRLLLVLAPAVSILGGVGVSGMVRFFLDATQVSEEEAERIKAKRGKTVRRVNSLVSLTGILALVYIISCFICHATFMGAEAYSSPSIVIMHKGRDGSRYVIDDYREAYRWLSQNTKKDAKIMSWWDYGYQITGMSNRTVLVDNNTWNNTHIATVGLAMASNEEDAFKVAQKLDVDYVLVIFGGYNRYSGDDINKFLWMVRIGGGVYPHIKEQNYYGARGYTIGPDATKTMLSSLMYSLCYYRFDEVKTSYQQPPGYDVLRNVMMGRKNIRLKRFEEAFTSKHWMIRIYRVKDLPNRVQIASKLTRQTLKAFPTDVDSFYRNNFRLYNLHKFKHKIH